MMNLEKSNIFFSANTPISVKEGISNWLGVKYSNQIGRYLGLPVIWGRSKATTLVVVRDKIGRKLQGWTQKLLTFVRREILIKSIAKSILTYPMTCFLFPKKSCVEIE